MNTITIQVDEDRNVMSGLKKVLSNITNTGSHSDVF